MLLFDGSEVAQPTQQRFMRELERFADKIRHVTESSPSPPDWFPWRKDPIRIAILDTGIDVKQDMLMRIALETKCIQECCGFVIERDSNPDPHDFQDLNGHGTHVTRLVLNAAPSAVIFIAKISDEITIGPQNMHRIARAINWATEKKVNIISMSFGLDCRDSDIDQAIHAAVNANISIFAAASNDGGNKPRVYPSSRSHGVLCIHASDGLGNDGGISPTPQRRKDNFSTLGIGIPSKCKGIPTHISGTSYATPIAAAFAADVLEFARHKCDLSEHETKVLCHFDGVSKILRLMVEQEVETRGGYDYVMPFHLWTTNRSDVQVAEMITEIVNT
ncbi:unnamed protein product [Clonostachys byssicola]|uniref:Peptidase S8/S53 domain-containing protein n=1 Tax=Clonostachys byssicola TaxID=160290 RepID=A0A9N9UGV3_9HYPO|nr:unnamed protein product [Clonostachys byssicola]